MVVWNKEPDELAISAHASRHQDGGADEVSVTGLSGLLADDQHVLDAEVTAVAIAKATVDAQSVLGGVADDTPVAIVVAEQTLVGRITGGNVTALTVAQIITLLDGATRTFLANAFQYPNPGTDWTPTASGAHLGVGLSTKTVWLPLNFLKVGDIITTYNLVGDAVISGTSTLDCKIVRLNKADPLTTTDLTNGAITQITADGNFDSTANVDDETVATDKQYYLEITGTTDAADEFYICGAEIQITRLV